MDKNIHTSLPNSPSAKKKKRGRKKEGKKRTEKSLENYSGRFGKNLEGGIFWGLFFSFEVV
jgi:hypothetical protein